MKAIQLILADQLFESNIDLACEVFVMIESLEEAKRYRYHQYKLAYLFACMREHCDYLKANGKKVIYVKLEENKTFAESLKVVSADYPQLFLLPTNDKWFGQNMSKWSSVFENVLQSSKTNQSFLTQTVEFQNWLDSNGDNQLKMSNFYIWQRRRLNILIEDGKPVGKKWSFDSENRKKIPKTVIIPERDWQYCSNHYAVVASRISEILPSNPGILSTQSWLPVTHNQAKSCLSEFLKTSLQEFGPYEDAITTRSEQVFHSVISPLLNNGLLTPKYVIEQVMQAYKTGQVTHLPSVEGYIRQIIGWREWVKGLYDHIYQAPYRQYNFFGHYQPLPEYFYNPIIAPNAIKQNIPLFDTLMTVHRLSWCHHIPRLMILSNWMVLNEYNPQECYEWFLSQFVDSAEWVMVANVYGMGLFADGGIFATKPYIGGGNYIKKMSDYPDSPLWEKTWTDLYWKFVKKNQVFLSQNPRMAMIIRSKFGKK